MIEVTDIKSDYYGQKGKIIEINKYGNKKILLESGIQCMLYDNEIKITNDFNVGDKVKCINKVYSIFNKIGKVKRILENLTDVDFEGKTYTVTKDSLELVNNDLRCLFELYKNVISLEESKICFILLKGGEAINCLFIIEERILNEIKANWDFNPVIMDDWIVAWDYPNATIKFYEKKEL